MRALLIRGCALLLLLSGLGTAQEGALTFEQILSKARQDHPVERAQQSSLRATEALIQQADVKPNPTISLQTQTDGFERVSQLGLLVSQKFELGGKKGARVKLAQANHSENRLLTELRLAQFRFEISEGFLRLLLAQKTEDLARQSLEITERHLGIAQLRFERGDISGAELASLSVERDRKKAQLEMASAALAAARANLQQFVPETALDSGVRGELATSGPLELEALDLSEALALRLARAGVKSKEAEVYLEKTSAVSDVTVQAGAFVQRTVFPGTSFQPSGALNGLDDTGPLLQLQIQIPIPLNDNRAGSIAAAKARQEQAELEVEATELKLVAEAENLFHTLSGQRKARVLLQEQAEPAARKALQSVEEAYRLGFRSQLDLLLAKQTYLETRKSILETGFEECLTAARLERALGRPLTTEDNNP